MWASLQSRPEPTETPADAQWSIVDSSRYLEDRAERIRMFAMAYVPGSLAGGGA